MVARRLVILLALAVGTASLGTLWAASPASAASADIGIDHNDATPDINGGPRLVAAGTETFVNLVAVAPPEEIGAWDIIIHYDDTVIDATDCEEGAGAGNVCNENYSATEVIDAGADISGVSGTNNLARIIFQAVGSAGSCSDLTVEVRTLTDPDAVDLDPVVSHGEICIVSPVTSHLGIDHNGGAPNINGGPALVVEGDSVDVRLVSQTTVPGLAGWDVNVAFNSAIVDATDCAAAPLGVNLCNPDYPGDIVRMSGADVAGVSGTTVMMGMTFATVAGRGNCSDLTVTVDTLVDPGLNDITHITLSSGRICIVGCADVTGDGRVNGRDAVRIFLHVLFGRPYDPALDLNGDQAVDVTDVLIALGQLRTTC